MVYNTTAPGQSISGSNDNEGVIHIPQNKNVIIRCSFFVVPIFVLVARPYPSAEDEVSYSKPRWESNKKTVTCTPDKAKFSK